MLSENKTLSKKVNEDIVPSMTTLNKLSSTIFESKHLLKNWVIFEKKINTPKKLRLIKINQTIYIDTKYELKNLSLQWSEEDKLKMSQIFNMSDSWFSQQKEIMNQLNSEEQYDDTEFNTKYMPFVNEGEPLMDLGDDLKNQIDQLYLIKNNALVAYNFELDKSFQLFTNRIIISGFILLVMVVLIAFLLVNSLLTPLNSIRRLITQMSKGELPKEKKYSSTDEIGQMGNALNDLISGLKRKAEFAREIETGNFHGTFKSESNTDLLGNSLLAMRNSLADAAKHETIRRKENEERHWITQGITEFNNIIREQSGSQEEFALTAVNKLTRYTNSQVGGIYIVNDSDPENIYLGLIAFYAYDRYKYVNKKILPGENLVGQCYLEKDTIYLTDIPKGYIKIISGLGQEEAKSVLIVPLIINEKIYGVAELASVEIFEPYQIEFVEKVSEILAATFSTIQINIQTANLLQESQEKSEILELQEKESLQIIDNLIIEIDNLKMQNLELKDNLKELNQIDKKAE